MSTEVTQRPRSGAQDGGLGGLVKDMKYAPKRAAIQQVSARRWTISRDIAKRPNRLFAHAGGGRVEQLH